VIKYAISDSSFFNLNSAKEYFSKLKADYFLYRDKNNPNYKKDAKNYLELANSFGFKGVIHQDYKLAKELNCNFVHLSSNQINDIPFAKELNLFTIISTHSIKEIKKAKELGADAVTFSPIFTTPNKGEPKGIESLKEVVECCDIKVIALGGIVSQNHIKQIASTKAWGFASIRYFKP
jgi:thiamine-phosphate pyrophosphorylase